jgi:nucleoside 2-deoxyribosyltransferase
MAEDISTIRAVLSEASVKFINIQEKIGIMEEKMEAMENHMYNCPARASHQAASMTGRALNLWVGILVGLSSLGSTVTLIVLWLKSK